MLEMTIDAIDSDRKSKRDDAVLDVVKVLSGFELAVAYERIEVWS